MRFYYQAMMRILAAVLMIVAGAMSAQAQTAPRPVVLELFTSQGCSSCPPADAFLAELAQRPDLVALELHVDFWDYIGWRDPFAQRAFSDRQRAYVRALQQRYVYTPQLVIDGRYQEVGSNRAAVMRQIERARANPAPGPQIELITSPGRAVRVSGPASGSCAVWHVVFDSRHETQVARGENRGRRLVNTNIVRKWELIGRFTGATIELPLAPVAGQQKAVVLVQAEDGLGPMLAARYVTPR
jgi:hypothetical protein